MNKKVLLGTVAAATLAVFFGTPYYLGMKAEQSLNEQHKILADTFFLEINERNYDRGWFSSTETTVVRIKPSVLANASKHLPDNIKTVIDKPLTIVNHVQHGLFADGLKPVRAVVSTEFKYDPEVQKVLARFFGDQVPVTMSNTIFLSGSGKLDVNVAKFDYEELSGIKLNWHGMNSSIDYENGFNAYTSQFDIPHLKAVLADKGDITIDQVRIKATTRSGSHDVALGSSETTLGKFDVAWKENIDYNIRLNELVNTVTDLQIGAFINPTGSIAPSNISVNNLSYTTQTDEKDGFINSQGKFTFEKLQYGTDTYGPLAIDIAAEHLDGKSLAAIKKNWATLSAQQLPDDKMQEEILNVVRKDGAGLFTNNPVFKINQFEFVAPSGYVKTKGQISLSGVQPADLDDFGILLKKMNINMDFDVSKAVIEQFAVSQARNLFAGDDLPKEDAKIDAAAQKDVDDTIRLLMGSMLDGMTSDGYLTQNNNAVQTNLSVQNSEVKLNGKVFTIQSDEELLAEIEADDEIAAASAPKAASAVKK